MSDRKLSATDAVERISALVTALSALAIGISTLNTNLKQVLPGLPDSNAMRWLVASMLAAVAALFGRRVLGRRAKLLRSEAFLVRPDRIEHLKGRSEDVERLLALCRQQPEVFLVGESGAGKTALIQSGLLPRLNESVLLPIYFNAWGHDWEEGPRSGIQEALRPLHARSLADASEEAAKQGRLLLVIFDQFDDYQCAHMARFRSAAQTMLSADELVSANSFWREVQAAIVNLKAHFIFVTRSDTQAGLESVRFVAPKIYPLDRLPATAATELLDSLTSATDEQHPTIASPEHGWTVLRDRLVRDLSTDGSVLPIRMSLSLAGLRTLPYLTTREYERHGGLQGLEAAYVEWRVQNGARTAGISNTDALQLLTAMVDRETQKTRPCTLDELCKTVPTVIPKAVASIVAEWELKKLLRPGLAADTGGETWSLDHDYLSIGVLAAEARANRSAVLLRDAEDDHRASGPDVSRWWRTLLTPRQQLGLMFDRIRGRFHYAEKRSFAFLSAIRLLPYAAILILVTVIASSQIDESHARDAMRHFDEIGVIGSITPSEVGAFWAISRSSTEVRRHFVMDAFRSAGKSVQLGQRLAIALHAAVGLNRDFRNDLVAEIRPFALTSQRDLTIRTTAVASLRTLNALDLDVVMAAANFPETLSAIDDASWKQTAKELTHGQADRLFNKIQPHPFTEDVVSDETLALVVRKMSAGAIEKLTERILNERIKLFKIRLAGMVAAYPLDATQKSKISSQLIQIAQDPSSPTSSIAKALRAAKSLGVQRPPSDAVRTIYSHLVSLPLVDMTAVLELLPNPMPVDIATSLISPIAAQSNSMQRNPNADAATIAAVVSKLASSDLPRIATPLQAWAEQAIAMELNDVLGIIPSDFVGLDIIISAARKAVEGWTASDVSEFLLENRKTSHRISPAFGRLVAAQLERAMTTEQDRSSLASAVRMSRILTTERTSLESTFAEQTFAALTAENGTSPALQEGHVEEARVHRGFGYEVATAWPAWSTMQREAAFASVLRRMDQGNFDLGLLWAAWPYLTAKQLTEASIRMKTRLPKHPVNFELSTMIMLGILPRPYSNVVQRQMLERIGEDDSQLIDLLVSETTLSEKLTLALFRKVVMIGGDQAITLLTHYPGQAKAFAAIAEESRDEATTDQRAAHAAEVLLRLQESPRALVEIAKKPTCFGACMITVLAHAENVAGRGQFNNDPWRFAAWAEQQNLGIDRMPQRRGVTSPRPEITIARLWQR